MAYTQTVLPAMTVGFYIPHFLSHLHPSLATHTNCNWIWQIFLVWMIIICGVLPYTVVAQTVDHDRINNPKRDLPTIRFAIGTCMALCACVWIYSLIMSP